ncbi:unnamed protein product, partial [Musa textilis]
ETTQRTRDSRPPIFWVLSGGSTPHPERRFGSLGLERRLDPSSRTAIRFSWS